MKVKGIRFETLVGETELDFPLFERDKEGGITSMHHPFTAPREEDLPLLEEDPEACRSLAYDLVLNGTEIGGGSIRIHQREIQEKIFGLIGLDMEDAKQQFGHMLEAFDVVPPPSLADMMMSTETAEMHRTTTDALQDLREDSLSSDSAARMMQLDSF